jgi:hypothetical protein
MPADHAFDIDSTVGRYWLANGSGFELVERGGRKLGVVENVVLDPSTQRVDAMVVKRRAAIGRTRVQAQNLTAVVPAAKLFVVAPGTSEALAHRSAGPALSATGRTFVRFVRTHWPAVRYACALAVATVARTARRLAAEAHEQWVSGRRARGGR